MPKFPAFLKLFARNLGPKTMLPLPSASSSRTYVLPVCLRNSIEHRHVSHHPFDAHPEEFADLTNVAAGRSNLLEDAVLAERLRIEADLSPGERPTDGRQPRSGSPVDEKVRVDRGGPPSLAVVEPRREPGAN